MTTSTSFGSKGSMPALLKYKIVFLGDQAVGKSSILNRYIYDIYSDQDHRPTIGIDFISQNIHLEEKTVRLQLWDTAGQERFKALIPNYIRDAAVIVIVYDVTNRTSFNNVLDWLQKAKDQSSPDIVYCLLANKIDSSERQVKQSEGEQIANKHNLLFRQVSAKSGVGVQQFFREMAIRLPGSSVESNRIIAPPVQNNNIILENRITSKKPGTKKCCGS